MLVIAIEKIVFTDVLMAARNHAEMQFWGVNAILMYLELHVVHPFTGSQRQEFETSKYEAGQKG